MCFVGAEVAGATAINTMMATSMAGGLLSAYGMYAQGQQRSAEAKANANIAKANAEISDAKARDAEYRGVQERQQIALQEEELRGQGRTAYAAGNVALGSGSPVDWEVDLTERAEADKRTSRYNAKVAAWGERTNASSSRYQASLYNKASQNAMTSGIISSTGSLLAGAGTVADKYYTYSPK